MGRASRKRQASRKATESDFLAELDAEIKKIEEYQVTDDFSGTERWLDIEEEAKRRLTEVKQKALETRKKAEEVAKVQYAETLKRLNDAEKKVDARAKAIKEGWNKRKVNAYRTNTQKTGTVTGYVLTSDGSAETVAPQNFNNEFGALERGLKSAVTEQDYFGTADKRNLPDGGIQQTVMFRDNPELEKNLTRASADIETGITTRNQLDDASSTLQKIKGVSYKGSAQFFGKKAKASLEKVIKNQMGGSVTWDGDTATYEYALGEDFVKAQEAKGLNPAKAFEMQAFKKARSQSDQVVKSEAKAERDKRREEQKEVIESSRKGLGHSVKLLALVGILTDITRRILTSVVDVTSKSRADTMQAQKYGMTLWQARDYNIRDVASGLKEGTTMGAIADIQSKVGDITNLDNKAVEKFALLLGSDVKHMVTSGLGGKEPDKLMAMTLDKAFALFREGKDWRGERVGQDQALRTLNTLLAEISPNLAEVFNAMAVNSRSGINAGAYTNYAEYTKLNQRNRLGLTDIELANVQSLGTVVDSIKANLEDFNNAVKTKLANSLRGFIGAIEDTTLFMSDQEKGEHAKSNRQLLQASVEADREQMKLAESTFSAGVKDKRYSAWANWTMQDVLKAKSRENEKAYAQRESGALMSEEEQKKAEEYAKYVALVRTASYDKDQSVMASLASYITTDERVAEDMGQLKSNTLKVKYNKATHTQEGKALAMRDWMVGIRANNVDANGWYQTALAMDLQKVVNDDGSLNLYKLQALNPKAYEQLEKAFAYNEATYAGNMDKSTLFDKDADGKWAISSEINKKSAYAKAVAKAMEGTGKSFFKNGNLTDEGLQRLAGVKNAGEERLRYYNSGEGRKLSEAEREKAMSSDPILQQYARLQRAQLSAFGTVALGNRAGFGADVALGDTFRASMGAIDSTLEEEAERLANSFVQPMNDLTSDTKAIRSALEKMSANTDLHYYRTVSYTEGKSETSINLVVKDSQNNVKFSKQIRTGYISGGAKSTHTEEIELDPSKLEG